MGDGLTTSLSSHSSLSLYFQRLQALKRSPREPGTFYLLLKRGVSSTPVCYCVILQVKRCGHLFWPGAGWPLCSCQAPPNQWLERRTRCSTKITYHRAKIARSAHWAKCNSAKKHSRHGYAVCLLSHVCGVGAVICLPLQSAETGTRSRSK